MVMVTTKKILGMVEMLVTTTIITGNWELFEWRLSHQQPTLKFLLTELSCFLLICLFECLLVGNYANNSGYNFFNNSNSYMKV